MEFPFHLRTTSDLVMTVGVFRQSPVLITNDSHVITFALYPVGIVNKSSLTAERVLPDMRTCTHFRQAQLFHGENQKEETLLLSGT
ncbi:hypothetical protein AS855_12495 [Brucella intermedia M86]|nr:hypothetical protein AS855_12495 [Brucella intermedia M86]